MNMSESCSQSIEHSCHHQILLSGFSSWSGRNGEWNSYWHGDRKSDEFGCECASDKTCQANGIELYDFRTWKFQLCPLFSESQIQNP